ncbi:MAG: ATP-binding cassette domain-containing protein [Flavobacteriales bacterium]|nr:ATP-binding cassette domain-containing protein [Flavobacteriales bacterium]
METILSINNLTKKYGSKYAIKNVSFDITKGNIYGLLGPNGSGKTTTLGIVLGIRNKTEGEYSWFSQAPSHHHLKRIGALLENPNFYPYMTGNDNLKIVADIKGVEYSKIDDKLKQVNLYERRFDKFETYSLGMKQRLAIASALLNDPEVLVLDEPTNGLDPQGIAEIREIISDVASKGTTILLASHLLDEIEKICTHVIVLKNGEVLYSGDIGSIKNNKGYVEVKSNDLTTLKNIISQHPNIADVKIDNDFVIANIKEDVAIEDLNKYLFEHNIFPSHLIFKTQSLEDKFLEITNSK